MFHCWSFTEPWGCQDPQGFGVLSLRADNMAEIRTQRCTGYAGRQLVEYSLLQSGWLFVCVCMLHMCAQVCGDKRTTLGVIAQVSSNLIN